MTFSQVAGTSIVPTFARIVLGVSFVSLGWCRLTEWIEYPADKAERLQALGVEIRTEPGGEQKTGTDADGASTPAGDDVSFRDPGVQFTLTSYRQDAGGDGAQQPPPEQQGGQETQPPAGQGEGQQPPPETKPPADQAPAQPPAAEQGQPPVTPSGEMNVIYKAKRMYSITLALDKRGFTKYGKLIAMGVAVTEMVGGGLLLIGLFSRLWAFLLVCGMGAAFYLGSMHFLVSTGNPIDLALSDNMDLFNRLARHLSFFVLGLLVMLAGPGPVSLDRLLFRREVIEPEAIEAD